MPESPSPSCPLRTLAFGDLDLRLWGAVWFPRPGAPGLLAIGQGGDARVIEAQLETAESQGQWRVSGEAVELTVDAAGDPVAMVAPEGAPSGFAQMCTVSGRWPAPAAANAAGPVPGCRGERQAPGSLERYDSVREVSAWFEHDEATALIALRPRKHRGHEQDEVGAVVIDAEGWGPVTDPRLSTTYTAAGEPARMGLELWPDDPERHPRRFAGEAVGPGAQAAVGGWELHAQPLRCHSRGRDGTGVYVLARPA